MRAKKEYAEQGAGVIHRCFQVPCCVEGRFILPLFSFSRRFSCLVETSVSGPLAPRSRCMEPGNVQAA